MSPHPSCWSDPLQPDLGKQDSHHFECHLVSRLPQVLLLHCVPLHPRWLHQCHPTCRQWHLPHSDLPPTRHHLQDWGGGCEEGRWSRQTEGKGHWEFYYWECRWGDKAVNTCSHWYQMASVCGQLWLLYLQRSHMGVGKATVSVVSASLLHYVYLCTCS